MRKGMVFGVVCILLLTAPIARAEPIKARKELRPGISVFRFQPKSLPLPNVVKVVSIEPSAKVKLVVVSAKPGTKGEPASVLCTRVKCLAAVNGGFFSLRTGKPLGGVSAELRGLLRLNIPGIGPDAVVIRGIAFNQHPGFTNVRHPRTLVCGNPAGKLRLITIDGRQPGYSLGMTVEQAARVTSELGCTKAVNLDGGCSTTLVVAARVVNRPCLDGIRSEMADGVMQRPVANILAVVPIKPPKPPIAPVQKPKPKPQPAVKVLAATEVKLQAAAIPMSPAEPRAQTGWLKILAPMTALAATALAYENQRRSKNRSGRRSTGSSFN